MSAPETYRVAAGTQVVADGVLHEAGATFTAAPAEVRSAVARGWVTVVEPKPSPKATKGTS